METYGHQDFEDLLKDPNNQYCFDCCMNLLTNLTS